MAKFKVEVILEADTLEDAEKFLNKSLQIDSYGDIEEEIEEPPIDDDDDDKD